MFVCSCICCCCSCILFSCSSIIFSVCISFIDDVDDLDDEDRLCVDGVIDRIDCTLDERVMLLFC